MKLCPNCRTPNDDDAKFCKECATSFIVKEAKKIEAPLISQHSAELADSDIHSVQEEKNQAPLDFLIEKVKIKIPKPVTNSQNQPSLSQKTKEWFKESYYGWFFLVMIALIFFVMIIGSNSSNNQLPSASFTSANNVSSEAALSPIIKVSESDIMEVDYSYLVDNFEKYKDTDKYFRIAGKISKASSSYSHSLSFKTIEGNNLVVDFQSTCILTSYQKDSFVTLVAKYYSDDHYSVKLTEGYIEESGVEAEHTYQRLKAEGDKLRAADAKAEKEKAKKAKKDYIASCKTYKYKDIARNPDKYYGKRAKFKGEVVQVIEGYFDTTLRVDVTKGKYGIYTDTMYVVYTPESSTENRILEDDIITIYGELSGIETYETVMGSKVSIPRIDAEYITINSK